MTEQGSPEVGEKPDIQWRAWHKVIYDMVRQWPPGRLLDIPSKEGALPSRLGPLGFQCVCADIFPGLFKAAVPFLLLDLNRPFPFRSESFDYVTFIEGIEHLERPYDAIGQVARVLKPGGRLIISTPNVLNLRSRVRFLFAGHHLRFNKISKGGHILALSYRELQYFLTQQGLEVVQIRTDRERKKAWPIHGLLSWLTRSHVRKRNVFAEQVLTPQLTNGRTIIIEAHKPA